MLIIVVCNLQLNGIKTESIHKTNNLHFPCDYCQGVFLLFLFALSWVLMAAIPLETDTNINVPPADIFDLDTAEAIPYRRYSSPSRSRPYTRSGSSTRYRMYG